MLEDNNYSTENAAVVREQTNAFDWYDTDIVFARVHIIHTMAPLCARVVWGHAKNCRRGGRRQNRVGPTKAGYRLTGFRYLQPVPAAGKKV